MSQYSDYHQELVALITYLSCTDFNSLRAIPLAKDLGLDKTRAQDTLESFPAFFRQSRDEKGDIYWTTQLRYSMRPNRTHLPEAKTEPLLPEQLSPLLEFISEMVSQEQESGRLSKQLNANYKALKRTSTLTLAAALLSALVALSLGILNYSKSTGSGSEVSVKQTQLELKNKDSH